MSKAVEDIMNFLRSEFLSLEDQAELIQRLRDGEADNHPPLGRWVMNGAPASGSIELVGTGDPDLPGLEITFYHGQMDGKPVIQIDGSADFRINVNDCPVWDQSTDMDYDMPEELSESLETRQRMLAKVKANERPKVWVGTISDADGTWVYVGASEEALYAEMRSNYGPVAFRDESDYDWTNRVANAGGLVHTDSYCVEGASGDD